jgi:hypothetical protein|tara:strand:+ start:1692 stop:1916 length:225 start_codon:yes stop_codon:yes gene_type:complete
MVDKTTLTKRDEKLFEQMAFQAARAIDYRDAVIETDELITDVLNMGGEFHSAQSLEIIRQRLRGRLAAAGLMIE